MQEEIMAKTLYDILQVSQKADIDVIDAAYTRLREKNEGDDASLKAIKQAYETLSAPARRAAYDQRFASQTIPPRSSASYRSDFADTGDEWWRSPMFKKALIGLAVLIGAGMFVSYMKHGKEVKVTGAVVNNDSRRVDNERTYIDRSMDVHDRRTDIHKETLDRSVELARMEQQRRASMSEAQMQQNAERMRMQREQQEFAQQQQANAMRMQAERERENAQQRAAQASNSNEARQLTALVSGAVAQRDYRRAEELAVTSEHWNIISSAKQTDIQNDQAQRDISRRNRPVTTNCYRDPYGNTRCTTQ